VSWQLKVSHVAFVLLLAGSFAASQTFRAKATLVTIPVNVTNLAGTQLVAGLSAKSFRLFEDGVEQQISVFDIASRPISLCILVDASFSMSGISDLARAAVNEIVARLRPDDEVTVMRFSRDATVVVPWRSGGSRRPIDWSRFKLEMDSNIISATKHALESLSAAQRERTAVLVVSDGKETGTARSVHSLAETRRQTEALVYALQPYPPAPEDQDFVRGRKFLEVLVGDSGGSVRRVIDESEVPRVAMEFLGELHSAYVLGYDPSVPLDGKYRKVRVEVQFDDLRVRHPAGYLATPR
jgi:VWFA-related protein